MWVTHGTLWADWWFVFSHASEGQTRLRLLGSGWPRWPGTCFPQGGRRTEARSLRPLPEPNHHLQPYHGSTAWSSERGMLKCVDMWWGRCKMQKADQCNACCPTFCFSKGQTGGVYGILSVCLWVVLLVFFLPALRVKPGISVLAGCKVVIRLRWVSADGIEVVLLPLHGMMKICTYIQEMKCFHETAHGVRAPRWESDKQICA